MFLSLISVAVVSLVLGFVVGVRLTYNHVNKGLKPAYAAIKHLQAIGKI